MQTVRWALSIAITLIASAPALALAPEFPPLPLPGPLGYDPAVAALDSCNRTGRNDLGAPYLADQVVQLCAQQRAVPARDPTIAASVRTCWSYTDQYTPLQQQAEALWTQAQHTPDPGTQQLLNQASALLQQSKTLLIQQAQCTNALVNSDERFAASASSPNPPPPPPPGGGSSPPVAGIRGGPDTPGPAYRAPIPGPAGGIDYVAGPDACRPNGPGGYDYCANGPGARLPPGCMCGGSGGPKGLTPSPIASSAPPPPKPSGPTLAQLISGINHCFTDHPPADEARFATYVPPTIAPANNAANPVMFDKNGKVLVDTNALQQETTSTQIFQLSTAFAQHAQQLHDQKYGPDDNSNQYDADPVSPLTAAGLDALGIDYRGSKADDTIIVGYVYRCLQYETLVPDSSIYDPTHDPRVLYAAFRGVPMNSNPVNTFSRGYGLGTLLPVSLYPPHSLLAPPLPPAR